MIKLFVVCLLLLIGGCEAAVHRDQACIHMKCRPGMRGVYYSNVDSCDCAIVYERKQ